MPFWKRFELKQSQLWVTTIGILLIMAMSILLSFYWWKTKSPRAAAHLYEESQSYYHGAKLLRLEAGVDYRKQIKAWQKAANSLERFVYQFPNSPNKFYAFKDLCDCYYQIAVEYEITEQKQKS